MKNKQYIFILILLSTLGYTNETNLQIGYDYVDFVHSKKKEQGNRYSIKISHKIDTNLYQLRYEKSDINTFKPPLVKNLHINKYYLKYTKKLNLLHSYSFSFASIHDNIMKETDKGKIYGFAYHYSRFSFAQYFSNYRHFNVYQTDLQYSYKQSFGEIQANATVIGKYIHLQNRKSNPFSQKAQKNYFTPSIKLHLHYHSYYLGMGAFFGKRIFAVMDNGFKVQHHAMEFNKTYIFGLGKHFDTFDIKIKYAYQEATEIPISNHGVEGKSIKILFGYHF